MRHSLEIKYSIKVGRDGAMLEILRRSNGAATNFTGPDLITLLRAYGLDCRSPAMYLGMGLVSRARDVEAVSM